MSTDTETPAPLKEIPRINPNARTFNPADAGFTLVDNKPESAGSPLPHLGGILDDPDIPWEFLKKNFDAVVIVNEDKIIVWINEQAVAVFGYDPTEVIGKPVLMLVPDDVKPKHDGYVDGYLRMPRQRPMGFGRQRGRTKKGNEFPANISLIWVNSIPHGRLTVATVSPIVDEQR